MNLKFIDRIQKLLSLATSPNEYEAKLAAAKANELLIKHNLTAEDIQLSDEEKYENREIATYRVFPFEARWVMQIISRHFFVKPVFRESRRFKVGDRGMAKVWFVGEKTNVQVASYVFTFLVNKYKQLWKNYQVETGSRNELKGAYYEGLTIGLSRRLDEGRRDVEQSMALVIVEDPKLKQQLAKFHPKLGKSNLKPMQRDDEILRDGYEAGKALHIARGLEQKSDGPAQLALADRRKS